MFPHPRVSFLFALLVVLVFMIEASSNLQTVSAETHYVSLDGDDENPGTKTLPWRSVSESVLRLTAGDRLLIQPGDYRGEGQMFVRSVDPETFEYLPLKGSSDATTYIMAATAKQPRIFGSFDIRGSHIVLSGLTIVGDRTTPNPGVGVFESHNITVRKCCLAYHGGGGILFNQSDLVRAHANLCYFNATTNPDQHSGISSYQPVVRTDTNERYGVVFTKNVCFGNRNEVPNSQGDVTDGNGIAVDDHRYTQFHGLLADVIAGTTDPGLSSGDPRIELDVEGNLLPYDRGSYVGGNVCVNNGGRGIHVFLADDVIVSRNICFSNLDSEALLNTLPRDDEGVPFFLWGEINVTDSTNVIVVCNSAFADSVESVGAAEQFFDLQGEVSTNRWRFNRILNFAAEGANVSVANSVTSELLLQTDHRRRWWTR